MKVWIVLSISAMSLLGRAEPLLVRNLSVEDGLSQSQVNCFFQDSLGFIWIGTQMGLNRFDGYNFEVFLPDANNPNSITGMDIEGLFEDEDGKIWVATFTGGVARFDRETETFEPIPLWDNNQKEAPAIFLMKGDDQGNLWVGTTKGVYKYNYRTGNLDIASVENNKLPHNSVRSLFLDHLGTMWVGTENGLVNYNPETDTWQTLPFTIDPPVAEKNNAVKAIAEDPYGRIWIGTRDGVFIYQQEEGTIKHLSVLPKEKQVGDSENIWELVFDGNHHIWGATHEQGIMRWDIDTYKPKRLSVDPTIQRGLPTNNIRTLFFDHKGILWIGTRGQGLSISNPDSAVFKTFQHQIGNPESISDNEIWYFDQTTDDSVWVSTFKGVSEMHLKTGKVSQYLETDNPETSLSTNFVNGLSCEPETGFVFVNGGEIIDYVNPVNHHVQHLEWLPVLKKAGLPEDFFKSVPTIISLKKDHLILVISDYLFDWNVKTQEVKSVQLAPDLSFSDGSKYAVNLIRLSDPARFLVVSNFGFYMVSTDLEEIHGTLIPKNGGTYDPPSSPYCACEGSDGNFWVGTKSEGILKLQFDGEKWKTLEQFKPHDGLVWEVFGVLQDNQGLVWASSMFGIIRLDPKNGAMKTFDFQDGLLGNEYNQGACIKDWNGRLYFGGVTGVLSFDPKELEKKETISPVVFTRFVSGEKDIHDLKDGDTIELGFSDRFFRIGFSVLDYTQPTKNTYKSQLEGYQTDWTFLGSENIQTFTNIDSGKYTYKLSGANSDGMWNPKPIELHIRIATPPWLSPLAFLGYFVLIGSIVGIIWRLQYVKVKERKANTQALKEREQRLTLALWGSGDTMWDWEEKSDTFLYTEISDALTRVTTQTFDEFLNAMHPEDREHVKRRWKRHLSGVLENFSAEFRKQNETGDWIWISQRGMVVQRNDSGRVERIAGTLKDITASKHSENNLRLLASAFESTLEAMVITDKEWNIMRVNQAFTQITGYSSDQIIGRSFHLLNSPEHEETFFGDIDSEIKKTGAWQGEVWMKNLFGRIFPTWRTTNMIQDTHGKLQYMTTVFLDISQHKKQENELRVLANYDHLTGLPNRSLFHDRLNQALAHCKRNELQMALCFLDLDRFKWINDSFGHKYGDLVLREVADRLKALVREQDTVARLGGDEFVIILEDIKNSRNAGMVAANIVKNLSTPMVLEGKEFVISTSLGIATYPDDGQNAQMLITNSDAAMYFAKNEGRNNYQFYAQTMNTQVHEKLDLETRLRRALKNEEMLLYLQPRISLDTFRPVGAEVLIRWNEPDKGIISPADFIPVAEDTGLIVPLGEWVFEKTCQLIVNSQIDALQDLSYSINISSRQFKEKGLPKRIDNLLKQYGIQPDRLELEITEGTIMERTDRTLEWLKQLKEIGVGISVDDFGTGYSSLSYLQSFPLNALKVDKSFVLNCDQESSKSLAIVKAIVGMGHNLGLKMVAEGIENHTQLGLLKNLKCEEGQGFLFSPPVPSDEFPGFLKQFEERVSKGEFS